MQQELTKSDIDWTIDEENFQVIGSHGGESFQHIYHDWAERGNDIESVKEAILLKFNKNYRIQNT